MSITGVAPAAVDGGEQQYRAPAALEVRPVRSRRELRAFIDFPYELYAGDAAWIPPWQTAVEARTSEIDDDAT